MALGGDSNVVLNEKEKWGKDRLSTYEHEFKSCLNDNEVKALSFVGVFSLGQTSKLVRLLLPKNLIEFWPMKSGWGCMGRLWLNLLSWVFLIIVMLACL